MTHVESGTPVQTLFLRLDLRSGAWIAVSLFVALALVGFLRSVPDSLTKVGVGILLAFALDPVVLKVQAALRCSRATAVALVGTAVVGLFAVLVLFLGPPAVDQARRFGRELPATVEELYDLPLAGGLLQRADVASKVRDWASDLPARVDTEAVTRTARSILDGVLSGLVVVFVGIAVLVDGDRLVRRLKAAIPDRIEPRAVRVGQVFYRTIGAYFSGSLLVASLSGTFVLAVGLAFGVPLAPAAALWMLVANLIPQVGGLLGGGFFVLLAVSQGVTTGLICLVLFLVYQQIENHEIQPAV
ncbi:MAG: AI-2E family transporter, partial [Acidimicrobiia bacterium]